MSHQQKIIRKCLAKIISSFYFLFEIATLIYQKFETSASTHFYFFGAKTQDFLVAAVSPPARKI